MGRSWVLAAVRHRLRRDVQPGCQAGHHPGRPQHRRCTWSWPDPSTSLLVVTMRLGAGMSVLDTHFEALQKLGCPAPTTVTVTSMGDGRRGSACVGSVTHGRVPHFVLREQSNGRCSLGDSHRLSGRLGCLRRRRFCCSDVCLSLSGGHNPALARQGGHPR